MIELRRDHYNRKRFTTLKVKSAFVLLQEAVVDIFRANVGERFRHFVAIVSLLPTLPRDVTSSTWSPQVSVEVSES